jgi:hypothetical protein
MVLRKIMPLIVSIGFIISSGCANLDHYFWTKEEIRFESRKKGIERLALSASKDKIERAEIYVHGKWVFIPQKGLENGLWLKNIESVTKHAEKGYDVEYYHIHLPDAVVSDFDTVYTTFPSPADFKQFGDNPHGIKLFVISPYTLTSYEYEKGSNSDSTLDSYIRFAILTAEKETNVVDFIKRGFKYEKNGLKVKIMPIK